MSTEALTASLVEDLTVGQLIAIYQPAGTLEKNVCSALVELFECSNIEFFHDEGEIHEGLISIALRQAAGKKGWRNKIKVNAYNSSGSKTAVLLKDARVTA